MTGARTLAAAVALALACVGGIVGMLLADGGWDWLFFAMTALPLAVGAWRWWRLRVPAARGAGAGWMS
ncbi:hypothetical protein [Xylophilus sp.]|uniref:hypothetical protein n=1 Tax=Xylophilus sp. TaxID=2653893 RepID=UPI0013B79023|nr:hypothetical protein [Xylophilus sp.]KAF1049782.1 MAG: hypothetical protein GAK38_00445 [Xylophilus sp.]